MFNLLSAFFKKRPHIKHRSAYRVELIQVFGAKVVEGERQVGGRCHDGKTGSLQVWRGTLGNPSQHGDHNNLIQRRFEGRVRQGDELCIYQHPRSEQMSIYGSQNRVPQ